MQISYRWVSRDLGKVEFVFAIIFISFLLGTLVNKSLILFSAAEKRLVEATVINIQTALNLQSTIQSIRKNYVDVIEIKEGMNPIILLQNAPDGYNQYTGSELDYVRARQATVRPLTNYLGEMLDPDIELLERGNWYFDYNDKLFIYLVKHKELFADTEESFELKYYVKLNYDDVDKNQKYDEGKDIFISASFINIDSNK